MNDAEVIAGLKEGNQVVFRNIVELYQVPLIRLCKGFLHHDADAKDVVQETFIEVFESIHQFRGESRLSTWIYRIAVNKSLNLIRRNKHKRWLISLEVLGTPRYAEQPILPDNSYDQPGYLMEDREKARHIRKAIDTLPENQRIAFILSKYQELSYKEIAEVMEISLASVESLLFRAKSNLQKKLFTLYKKNLL